MVTTNWTLEDRPQVVSQLLIDDTYFLLIDQSGAGYTLLLEDIDATGATKWQREQKPTGVFNLEDRDIITNWQLEDK